MSQNIFEDIKQIYSAINESSHLETDMKKRRENNEKAIEDMKNTKAHKDMTRAARKSMGIVDEAKKEDKKGKVKRWWDDDGDGIGWEKGEVKKEAKEPRWQDSDGDGKWYEPGEDVAAPKKGKKKIKEGFSNWRGELFEIVDEMEKETNKKKIEGKNVKNNSIIKINPDLEESIEEIGGTLIEMMEINEIDFILESAYDELLEEGYEEDDIEEALEYALTEAKVTMGHDTPAEKKRSGLLAAARQKLSGAKKAVKQAVATGARKVAKGALGVARKMEGGDNKPNPRSKGAKPVSAAKRPPSAAGQKEKVSSGSYKAPEKKKMEPIEDPWKGSEKTPSKTKTVTKKAAAPKTKAPVAKKKKKSNLDNLLDTIRNEEVQLDEKSLSRAQQRFMGMVYAAKKGGTPASPEVAKVASGMTKTAARDFAKTKHAKLPEKVIEAAEGDVQSQTKSQQIQKQQIALDRKKLQMKMQQASKKEPTPSADLITQESVEIEEGMTMKDFKQQRSRQKQKEKRAAEKTSPLRRAGIHDDKASPERDARHRANVDPDFDGDDSVNYPGGKLKNPKKIRKAKAVGEITTESRRMDREGVDRGDVGRENRVAKAKASVAAVKKRQAVLDKHEKKTGVKLDISKSVEGKAHAKNFPGSRQTPKVKGAKETETETQNRRVGRHNERMIKHGPTTKEKKVAAGYAKHEADYKKSYGQNKSAWD